MPLGLMTYSNVEAAIEIDVADMPINSWSTHSIDMSDFQDAGLTSSANIAQIILKPMGGAETFYLDDFYFGLNGSIPFLQRARPRLLMQQMWYLCTVMPLDMVQTI